MAFSGLLLLPAIAAILIFQGTWLDNGFAARGRPKKYQRRLKAKVLIHRSLIVSLLLATFIVFTSTLTVLSQFVQGLLVTVLLMLPVLAYLLLAYLFTEVLKWRGDKTLPAVNTFEQHVLQSSTEPAKHTALVRQIGTARPTFKQGTSELATQFHDVEPRQVTPLKKLGNGSSNEDSDSVINHTLNLDEQMDNIDRSVDHADIGVEGLLDNRDFSAPSTVTHTHIPRQNTLAAAQDHFESDLALRTADQQTSPTTQYGELTEMVMRLQNEKIKLQKLTIAQKAIIETERQRNQKSQMMAQDAMTVMRSARKKANDAIKIARHERRKRQRLEADYAKARVQIENAMSARRIMKSANG